MAGGKKGTARASSSPSLAGPSSSLLTNRVRIMLFAVPILLSWVILLQRRSASKPLPKSFAVCSRPKADLQIHTMDANDSRVECMVVAEGKIVDVGSLEDVRSVWGDVDKYGRVHLGKGGGIKIMYLRKGQMLMPGLIDAHAHVLQYGEAATAVNLVGSTSVQDVVERIADFIANNSALQEDKTKFILGLGWDQSKWTGGTFPTAEDLEKDSRLAGRAIYLKRIDVHALWISKAILAMLEDLPPEVPGGLIVRSSNGLPTGVFVDNAMSLVLKVIPPWTDADRLSFLKIAARKMLDSGLTSVHDASLTTLDIDFLKKIDRDGLLPVRIYGMTSCEPLNTFCGDEVERYDGDRFTLRAVKLFADGALGSWGAAMLEPYSDNPKERGIMISEEDTFNPLVGKWMDKGFQVCSHAIGDRANKVLLDAYEAQLQNRRGEDLRPRIEHAQIMRVEDIKRFGELGVIASFQPTHATSDMGYAETRVGRERIRGAYAWQSLIREGSRIALGSDFPVEAVEPIPGIYAAVSRLWKNGDSPHGPGGWYPGEKLTMQQALRGFTIDAAYASFQETRVGSLEVGKEADFIILDQELTQEEEARILGTKVVATVVGGHLWYGKLQ